MTFSFFDDDDDIVIEPDEDILATKPRMADIIREAMSNSPVATPVQQEINIDDDPEVIAAYEEAKAAADKIAEAEADTAEPKEELHELNEEVAATQRAIEELRAKLYELDTKRSSINSAVLDKRRALNYAKRAQEEAARRIEVAKANALQKKRVQLSVEGYSRVAEQFSWRTGVEMPDGKVISALPHQWEGIQFLASAGRAILGDTMGLGKTLEAIAALDLVGSTRALVITPADVTSNFLREVKRWAPHRRVINLKGLTKADREMHLSVAAYAKQIIVIVNYEAWRKDLSLLQLFIDFGFDTLIADEAHAIKATRTDAFKGVETVALADNVCGYCGSIMTEKDNRGFRLCSKDGFREGNSVRMINPNLSDSEAAMSVRSIKNLWLMTGTPILNAPEDLYPMLYLIDPIAFPYKSEYLRNFCTMDQNTGKYRFRSGGLESLVKRLSGRYLARTLESAGVTLPPQDVTYHLVEIQDDYLDQLNIIQQLSKHSQIVLSEKNKMSAIGVLALITRQRQANVWPGGIQIWEHPKDIFGQPMLDEPKELVFDAGEIQESIKVDKAMELIDEFVVQEGCRLAVFSQFRTGLAEIERRLSSLGVRAVRFDGSTPDPLKDRIKTNFDKSAGETPEWEVVLCNYKTGGVGLNLTAATHTIILDEEWNPGKRNQAYARTQRMGQDENTFVHVIRLAKTVDTWLANLIDEKEELISGFDSAAVDIQEQFLSALRDGTIV